MKNIIAPRRALFAAAALIATALAAHAPLHAQSTAAPAAQAPTPEELIEALKSKGARGLHANDPAAAKAIEQDKLIERLKAKSARGLSTDEREELAVAVKERPAFDLEINFEFMSATVSERAKPALKSVGEALQGVDLKGGSYMVAGHTDAIGSAPFNQALSEKRAKAVKDYLVSTYNVPADSLMAVGYGKEKLKDPAKPNDGVNRRVQIINITPTVTSSNAN